MTKTKLQQQKQLKKPNSTDHPKELTFLEHVHELRKRIFWVIFVLVLASAAGFQIKDQLIAATMEPLHGQKLIYLTPGGGFSFIFTLSLYFGALITIPFAVYHLYRFLQPIMKRVSRRFVAVFIILSCLLAALGALFGYFVTIPAALNFLATFAGDAVVPSLTAESYLGFVVTYVLGLAVLFQLPLLLFLLDHIRPFPPGSLMSTQRFVIIGATVISAVITPTPDAFNMAIVAVPIVVIYEIGAVAVLIRHRIIRTSPAVAKQLTDSDIVLQQEPLTAIIDELEQPIVAVVEVKETETIPTILPTFQRPQQTVRTMDGIIMARKAPAGVNVPARAVGGRLATDRLSESRTLRSRNGFSMGMG
ncbi:MAG: Sec-independent protein translocase subunit TatC, sec-independent protein translocase protein TatC [Candidatus Saccharibacteria bacterium]|nr:Sec-independent protein translocase subunit TatC, sec-independent protein translocase protein TatC [Candidatus Saccharibacteria bacterium]